MRFFPVVLVSTCRRRRRCSTKAKEASIRGEGGDVLSAGRRRGDVEGGNEGSLKRRGSVFICRGLGLNVSQVGRHVLAC